MLPVICCVPTSSLRSAPDHKAEMISQLLFGECAEMQESNGSWVKVKCKYDGYTGWCQESHITEISGSQYEEEGKALTRAWITELEYNGRPMKVPLGSSMTAFRKGRASWEKNRIRHHGKTWDPQKAKKNKNKKQIRRLAHDFLNTTYLWGGKTVFGTDCSGYTQTVFRFFNVHLLRDAWQQAGQGESVGSLSRSDFGDLAFFDNEEGRIIHVGILLNKKRIIHASGTVRIDKIDQEGIIQSGNDRPTHHLKFIKRYF